MSIPSPDVLATEVPIESLTSTAASIANAALDLGYRVTAARALGSRLPKVAGQAVVRQQLTIVTGVRGEFGFKARHTDIDGWDVRIRRPGWPDLDSSVAGLRLMLKAQGIRDSEDEIAARRAAYLKASQNAGLVFSG